MEYYLLSVGEGKEALEFEEALKRIDYDVDDRDSTWSKEDIVSKRKCNKNDFTVFA